MPSARGSSRTSQYKCTGCDSKILSAANAKLHPLIGTLICRTCCYNYGNGKFAELYEEGVDEFDDDNFCRWCCDGGDLYCCMNDDGEKERCHYSFCRDCIQRNLPDDPILSHEDLDDEDGRKIRWHCYACDLSKVKAFNKNAIAAIQDLTNQELKKRSNESGSPQAKKRRTTEPKSVEKSSLQVKAVDKHPSSLSKPLEKPSSSLPKPADKPPSVQAKAVEKPQSSQSKPVEKPQPPQPKLAEKPSSLPSKPVEKSTNPQSKPTEKPTSTQPKLAEKPSTPQPKPVEKISSTLPKPVEKSTNSQSKPSEKPTSTQSKSAEKTSSLQPKPVEKPLTSQPKSLKQNFPVGAFITPLKTNAPVSSSNNPVGTAPSIPLSQKEIDELNQKIEKTLTESDLKQRLDVYRKTKEYCIKEIGSKFETIVDLFKLTKSSKGPRTKKLISIQIDGLRKPIMEFESMINDLKQQAVYCD